MNDRIDILQWLHQHVPFAAMLATEEIGKRPLLTRVIESLSIALAGGAFAAYITLTSLQAVHSAQILDLHREIAQEHQDTVMQIQSLQMQITDVQSGVTATRNHQLRQRP
jgi:hypothetical protein